MLNNGWLDEHILVKDKYPPSIYLGQEVLGGLDFGMFVCMQWHILGVRLKFICPFHAGCHGMMLVLYCVWVTCRSLTHRTRAIVEFSAGVTLFELGMFWMLAFGVFWCRTVNLHINFRFRNSFGYKPKSETGNSRSSSVFISAALYYFHRHCHQQSTQVPVTPRQFMLIAWISDERLTYCYADMKLMDFNKLKKPDWKTGNISPQKTHEWPTDTQHCQNSRASFCLKNPCRPGVEPALGDPIFEWHLCWQAICPSGPAPSALCLGDEGPHKGSFSVE